MTNNPDKIICYIDRCQAIATRFIYIRDPDSTAADVFLCQKHWKKGKRFLKLVDPAIRSDFREAGFEPLPVSSWFVEG